MLIPQFSLRWMFGLTTVCAVIFAVVAAGMRGNSWAVGVTIGLLALVLMFSIHAGLFALTWLFAAVSTPLARAAKPEGRSPFRDDLPGNPPPPADETPAAATILDAPIILDD